MNTHLTKDEVAKAAFNYVRRFGYASITHEEVAKFARVKPEIVYSYYDTTESLLAAVWTESIQLFETYAVRGFKLVPHYKGFIIEFLRFASAEKEIFKFFFLTRKFKSLDEFYGSMVHTDIIVEQIMNSFSVSKDEAYLIHRQVFAAILGLATAYAFSIFPPNDVEMANIAGNAIRAAVLNVRAGLDSIVNSVPYDTSDEEISLDVYLSNGINELKDASLINVKKVLLQHDKLYSELKENPRYLHENDWKHIYSMMSAILDLDLNSLTKTHPGFTESDFKLLILQISGTSVSDMAVLLGISSPSVTKARQRLKNKFGVNNIADLLK